ncbi:MAG: hypothetical protein FWC92_01915 [Defluviitaleaceae bacterium]|nr:hypothetical protein [Defluviitaleaceae bacterium]
MVAIRKDAIRQLEQVPEDKLQGVIEYMRLVCEPSPPYDVTTKEEFYEKIEAGLEDMQQGNVRPFSDVMKEIRNELQLRIQKA